MGTPSCDGVVRLGKGASPRASLMAVRRTPVGVLSLLAARRPSSWTAVAEPAGAITPAGAGTAQLPVTVPARGLYEVWVGGSVRGELTASVGQDAIGRVRHVLNNRGQFTSLGTALLEAGPNSLSLTYGGEDLLPGSGGRDAALGPVIVSSASREREVEEVPLGQAVRLCSRPFDWVELLDGVSSGDSAGADAG